MTYSGYILDVEGTLVDSVPQALLSLQEALAGFGFTVPYELLQLYSGLDGNQTLQLVAPELRADQRKEVLKAKGEIYEAKYLGSVKAFNGVRDVFEALIKRGGRIALATDCKGPELKRYRSLMNVDDLIDSTACGDDVEHWKTGSAACGPCAEKTRRVCREGGNDRRHSVRRGSRARCGHLCSRRSHGGVFQGSPGGGGMFRCCQGIAGPTDVPGKFAS